MNDAQRSLGSALAATARSARSTGRSLGRPICRRSTFSWWRSTRISMSLEPSSAELATRRATARAIRERRNSIRACYGSASWKANRSFRPLHAPRQPGRPGRAPPKSVPHGALAPDLEVALDDPLDEPIEHLVLVPVDRAVAHALEEVELRGRGEAGDGLGVLRRGFDGLGETHHREGDCARSELVP